MARKTYQQYVAEAQEAGVQPLSEQEWTTQTQSGLSSEYDKATRDNDKAAADAVIKQAQNEVIDKNKLKQEKLKETVSKPSSLAGEDSAQESFNSSIKNTHKNLREKAKEGYSNLKTNISKNFENREEKTKNANNEMSNLIAKAYQGEQLSQDDINSLLNNYKYLQEELETKGPSAGTQVMNLASAISALASLQSGGEFQPIDFSQYGMSKDKEDREMFKNNLNNLSNQISDLFSKSKIDTASGQAQSAITSAEDEKQIAADQTNTLNQIEENELNTNLEINQDEANRLNDMAGYKLTDAINSASAENLALFQQQLTEFARQNGLINDVNLINSMNNPNEVINALAKMGQAIQARDSGNGALMQGFNKFLSGAQGVLGVAGSMAAFSDKNVKSYLLNITI